MGALETVEHRGWANRRRARRWGRRHGRDACEHPRLLQASNLIDLGRGKIIACRLCGAITII